MKIKKVVAADMQQALQQIRRELGEDAVIISTAREPVRSIRQLFGPRLIEVTAAVDDHEFILPVQQNVVETPAPPLLLETPAPAERNVTVSSPGNEHEAPARIIPGGLVPAQIPEPSIESFTKNQNDGFNIVLQQELNKGGDKMDGGLPGKWKKLFERAEINGVIIGKLLKDMPSNMGQDDSLSEDIFRAYLKKRIIDLVRPAYADESAARIHSFIGPTGVGKTLTLAKLATKSKVVKKKQIGLIAVYNHRFGAVEKLNYYGKIIDAPVDVVMTPDELTLAVEKHSDKDVVFIDTEGRPSMNRSQLLELNTFMGAVEENQNIHLVLGAPTKNRDLIRIANDFLPIGYGKIIFTKMDETDTYGSMLNVVYDTGLPVGHVTRGQNVPDDIECMTPKRLADVIIGGLITDEDYQS